MNEALAARIGAALGRTLDPAVAEFARVLGEEAGARAVLFYGSNLRTGSLEGVLDFYVLLPGPRENGIWPTVSYRERAFDGGLLRAKIASMTLATFAAAAAGQSLDTTIWARFVQPVALAWHGDASARDDVRAALTEATRTSARVAVAVGPTSGTEGDYWRALFRATYGAELRVEAAGREEAILSANRAHFDGLLPLALIAEGIAFGQDGARLTPRLEPGRRSALRRWWDRRRRIGKLLNVARLAKATTTFQGGMRYAAWKVERHTGLPVKITPLRERFPLIAVPSVVRQLWRARRKQPGAR